MITESKETVYTPLGRGQVVYELGDGTIVVEFPHGGGHIFLPQEVFRDRLGGGRLNVTDPGKDGQVRRTGLP